MRLWLSLTLLVVLACVVAEISAAKSKREDDSAKKGHHRSNSKEVRYSKSKSEHKNKGKNKENFRTHEKKKRSSHETFVADGKSKRQRRGSGGQEVREEVVKVKSYKSPKVDKHAEKLQAKERIVDKETKRESKRDERSGVVERTKNSVADSTTVEEKVLNEFSDDSAQSDKKSWQKLGKQNANVRKSKKQNSNDAPNLPEQESNEPTSRKLVESERLDAEKWVVPAAESEDHETSEQDDRVKDAKKANKKRSNHKKSKYSAENNEDGQQNETREEKTVDDETKVGMETVAGENCVDTAIQTGDQCPVE